jgi:predicted nucleic acid-binding protein
LKRFLLDTNIVSETRKLRPHGAVVAWLDSLVRERVFFPSVVFWELQVGIESIRNQDPAKAQEIEAWVDDMVSTQQILSMDVASFRECARLMQGKPQDLLGDAMIAATARVHGLTVATRNERDFALFDVPVLNPFRFSS